MRQLPAEPRAPPTWCSSDKDLVGCALGPPRLWFSVGHGVLNEIYYPRIDIPHIRDLGFIVADGQGFWVEVKRLLRREVHCLGLACRPWRRCTGKSVSPRP